MSVFQTAQWGEFTLIFFQSRSKNSPPPPTHNGQQVVYDVPLCPKCTGQISYSRVWTTQKRMSRGRSLNKTQRRSNSLTLPEYKLCVGLVDLPDVSKVASSLLLANGRVRTLFTPDARRRKMPTNDIRVAVKDTARWICKMRRTSA